MVVILLAAVTIVTHRDKSHISNSCPNGSGTQEIDQSVSKRYVARCFDPICHGADEAALLRHALREE